GRHLRHPDIEPRLAVEHRLQPRRGAHTHMVVRARNDELVRLYVLEKHELPGFRTLDPEILGRLAPIQERPDFRPDNVGDPVHTVRLSMSESAPFQMHQSAMKPDALTTGPQRSISDFTMAANSA